MVRLVCLACASFVITKDPGGAEGVHAFECIKATEVLCPLEAITPGRYVHLDVVLPCFVMCRHLDALPDREELFLHFSASFDIGLQLLCLETGIV